MLHIPLTFSIGGQHRHLAFVSHHEVDQQILMMMMIGWISVLLLLFALSSTIDALILMPPAVAHTVAGAIAGSSGAIAAYPMDFVKSQLQTEDGRAKYNGGMDAAVDIVQSDGILGLYRGVMVNIVGIAPEKTIKLSANDAVRMLIIAHFGSLPLLGEVAAGGIAGMTQVIVTNPLEVVKVRMQTGNEQLPELLGKLRGVADLYKGAGACIARDVIFSAVLFPLYAHAKELMVVPEYAFWTNMLAGSLAAAPAAFISTPADVVKTRLQQAGSTAHSSGSFWDIGRTICQEEGPEVLFSGWMERIVRSVPQFGVTLAVFDVVSDFIVQQGWTEVPIL